MGYKYAQNNVTIEVGIGGTSDITDKSLAKKRVIFKATTDGDLDVLLYEHDGATPTLRDTVNVNAATIVKNYRDVTFLNRGWMGFASNELTDPVVVSAEFVAKATQNIVGNITTCIGGG